MRYSYRARNERNQYIVSEALKVCRYSHKNMAYAYSYLKNGGDSSRKGKSYGNYAVKYDKLFAATFNNLMTYYEQTKMPLTKNRQIAQE